MRLLLPILLELNINFAKSISTYSTELTHLEIESIADCVHSSSPFGNYTESQYVQMLISILQNTCTHHCLYLTYNTSPLLTHYSWRWGHWKRSLHGPNTTRPIIFQRPTHPTRDTTQPTPGPSKLHCYLALPTTLGDQNNALRMPHCYFTLPTLNRPGPIPHPSNVPLQVDPTHNTRGRTPGPSNMAHPPYHIPTRRNWLDRGNGRGHRRGGIGHNRSPQ